MPSNVQVVAFASGVAIVRLATRNAVKRVRLNMAMDQPGKDNFDHRLAKPPEVINMAGRELDAIEMQLVLSFKKGGIRKGNIYDQG